MENNGQITVAPIEITVADHARDDAVALYEQARRVVITAQPDYEMAGGLLQKVKKKAREFDGQRKEITKPMDEAKSKAMALFKPPLDMLKEAECHLKRDMIDYTNEQERKRREQEEKLRRQAAAEEARKKRALEEQARKKEAEARRLREEAEKANAEERERLEAEASKKEAEAEARREKAEDVHVEAPVLAPTIEKPAGISYAVKWTAQVLDKKAVPEEYKLINESALNKVAQATKGSIAIPGVVFTSEKVVSSRRQ